MTHPPCVFRPAYHRPSFYRYRIADPGLRLMRNRYEGQYGAATIGLALTARHYAYCIKWADARTVLPQLSVQTFYDFLEAALAPPEEPP